MVHYLFKSETTLETLTFKYFEKGHTFMSADSFHHQVEDRNRRKKHLYDFNDFVEYVVPSENVSLWRQKIFSISVVTQAKQRIQIIPNLSKFQKSSSAKEIRKRFAKLRLRNPNINLANSYRKNFESNVEKKFLVKRKVLQKESICRKKWILFKNW